jgi:hypothetical protein
MISTEMMIDLCIFSFGLSCGFWMIYGLYTAIRIQHFIVKRYEIETNLMDAVFFQEHATFTRWLPPFFSSALYTGHLMMLLWGWRIYYNKKAFRDIDKPSKVLSHFSKGELKRVKKYGISMIVVILHMIIGYLLNSYCPELFS